MAAVIWVSDDPVGPLPKPSSSEGGSSVLVMQTVRRRFSESWSPCCRDSVLMGRSYKLGDLVIKGTSGFIYLQQ